MNTKSSNFYILVASNESTGAFALCPADDLTNVFSAVFRRVPGHSHEYNRHTGMEIIGALQRWLNQFPINERVFAAFYVEAQIRFFKEKAPFEPLHNWFDLGSYASGLCEGAGVPHFHLGSALPSVRPDVREQLSVLAETFAKLRNFRENYRELYDRAEREVQGFFFKLLSAQSGGGSRN